MPVKLDITNGARLSHDKNGYRAERIAHISGVIGDVDALLYQALTDPEMPVYGDPHPSIPEITLRSISNLRSVGGGRYQATLSYYDEKGSESGSANATMRVSSATAPEQFDHDVNGNRLQARFQAFFEDNTATSSTVQYKSRLWTAEVEIPRKTYDFEYTTDSYPRGEVDHYEGTINALNWNGYAPGTILCSSVNISEEADRWRVRFSFAHNAEEWHFVGAIKKDDMIFPLNPHPTEPDPDVDLSTGLKVFQLYPSVDFNPLGFVIPGPYAVMTGTVLSSTDESHIVAGGRTIILTLTDDTWVTAGAAFDAERQGILDGLTSNRNEATGWDAMSIGVGNVVRTSDTVVTITLPALGTYDIAETETISCVVPASSLVTSQVPLKVSQRFTITAV